MLTVRATGTAPVYNLTVAGVHEYYANGVLVSNCDSLRYIVGYIRNQTGTEFRAATGGERPLATGYTPR